MSAIRIDNRDNEPVYEKDNTRKINCNINFDFTIVKLRVMTIITLYLLFLSIGIAIPISVQDYNFNNAINNSNNTNIFGDTSCINPSCKISNNSLYPLFLANRIFCILTIVVFFTQYLNKQFFPEWEKTILTTKIIGTIFALLYFIFILIHIYAFSENCIPIGSRKSIYLVSLYDVILFTNLLCIVIRRFMYYKK